MKKILLTVLIGLSLISLVGCGSVDNRRATIQKNKEKSRIERQKQLQEQAKERDPRLAVLTEKERNLWQQLHRRGHIVSKGLLDSYVENVKTKKYRRGVQAGDAYLAAQDFIDLGSMNEAYKYAKISAGIFVNEWNSLDATDRSWYHDIAQKSLTLYNRLKSVYGGEDLQAKAVKRKVGFWKTGYNSAWQYAGSEPSISTASSFSSNSDSGRCPRGGRWYLEKVQNLPGGDKLYVVSGQGTCSKSTLSSAISCACQ